MSSTSVADLTADAAGAAIPSPNSATPLGFVTEPKSPWPDGYSLEGEREALADLFNADDAEADPRYPRLVEFERREAQLKREQAAYTRRKGADVMVSDREAMAFSELGALVDDEQDTMEIHTMEGFRLFMGRVKSPDGQFREIPGGKRQGAALRTLWLMTSNDNPFAEWALLLHEQSHAHLASQLEAEIKRCQATLSEQAQRGLALNVVVSAKPQRVGLNFRSPYGYSVARLVIDFDLFVRFVKTLARKNLLDDDMARTKIRNTTRNIRYAWLELQRFDRYLARAELRDLSRADFLLNADAQGQKRAQAVTQLFPGIPADIFAGKHRPKHSRRRGVFTDADRTLLLATLKEVEKQLDAAADVGAEPDASGLIE